MAGRCNIKYLGCEKHDGKIICHFQGKKSGTIRTEASINEKGEPTMIRSSALEKGGEESEVKCAEGMTMDRVRNRRLAGDDFTGGK